MLLGNEILNECGPGAKRTLLELQRLVSDIVCLGRERLFCVPKFPQRPFQAAALSVKCNFV
jgi:hypothetical protein